MNLLYISSECEQPKKCTMTSKTYLKQGFLDQNDHIAIGDKVLRILEVCSRAIELLVLDIFGLRGIRLVHIGGGRGAKKTEGG